MEVIICKYDHVAKVLTPQGSAQPCRLENFIQCWNKQPKCHLLPIDVKSDFDLRIVYHGCKVLYNGNKYSWNQDYYVNDGVKLQPIIPTIHLTMFDVFAGSNQKGKEENVISTLVQRYKKVVDSSIWNYYVPIEINNSEFDYQHFNQALCEIGHNYDEGRYSLSITLEYADLHARLLEQSYLKGGHKGVSPFLFHSEKEMKNKLQNLCLNEESNDKEENKCDTKIVKDEVKKYKWRFLLLDDKSVDQMSGISGQKDKCKVQIIKDNLHRILGFDEEKIWFRVFDFKPVRESNNDCRIIDEESHKIIEDIIVKDSNGNEIKKTVELEKTPFGRVKNGIFDDETKKLKPTDQYSLSNVNDIQIIIDCVKHVDAAQYCLQKYRYDIVLMDYLLDKDKIKGEHKQEYGYQLLDELWKWHKRRDDNTCRYMIGPNNSLIIMFISAFTTAVNERILEMGLGRSEPGLWYIGNGACPTNTPYLFSYLLLQLMRHRILDLSRQREGGVFSVVDLLESIYQDKDIREAAHCRFNQLLFMRDKYRRIENDLEKKDEQHLRENPNDAEYIMNMSSSLLVYSAFNIVHHFSGAFFDHLQHLVYLTAFGTIRQSDEMDMELNNVYKELVEYDDIMSNVSGERTNRGRHVCDAIRNYIVELENNLIK